ncbi:nitroreductase family deazaflavin-dependent oxidoreductase [Frankia sp. Mgl5]|uniref:nitroreductase/quinone reductase family protein n=1 Tax=Frankia sp. Mgl5 TaxID=2933793 RepID=UPI00200E0CCA|nr:nitroreductase/quinone reductase family protein [Frankia sp. Mgl5]MCK9928556.1 nitroreductase family deazaflavin-dependent oxidoreductase [Frankia sp. Mgl5]
MTETRDPRSRGFDFRVVNQAVIAEYRANGGRLEKTLSGSRLLLLTTVGERTGRPHTTPLGYVVDGHPAPGAPDAPPNALDVTRDGPHATPAGPHATPDSLNARPDGPDRDIPARRLVVYASNMAAAAHPQWYRNLLAHPKVTVELDADRFDAEASTAVGAERERLYAALVDGMPGLRTHQEQTTREIPVVVLAALR